MSLSPKSNTQRTKFVTELGVGLEDATVLLANAPIMCLKIHSNSFLRRPPSETLINRVTYDVDFNFLLNLKRRGWLSLLWASQELDLKHSEDRKIAKKYRFSDSFSGFLLPNGKNDDLSPAQEGYAERMLPSVIVYILTTVI